MNYKRSTHFRCFLKLQPTLSINRFSNEPNLIDKHQELFTLFGKCFDLVSDSFDKLFRPMRKNMLSFKYVLYKLYQLLDMKNELEEIAMFKTEEKIVYHDNMWKMICEDLNWKYLPSINHSC